jgi:protoporphyrinogen IX oxidase
MVEAQGFAERDGGSARLMFYLWLKAVHVIAAILFMAGNFAALIFIQWLQTQWSSSDTRNVAVMLRHWNARVTTPAMLAVWGLGLTLAMRGGWGSSDWLKLKFICVLALSALHGIHSGALRRIAAGMPVRQMVDARAVTVVLTMIVVMLAVAKPL